MLNAMSGLDAPMTPRPVVAVVSDAPSVQSYLQICLSLDFEVLSVDRFEALAEAADGRHLDLIVSDLHTLDHHDEAALACLTTTFEGVPFLLGSQEPVAQARMMRPLQHVEPQMMLPLPTSWTTIRRVARALLRFDAPGA